MLHLGRGWLSHGGVVERLPPPAVVFESLRTKCARVPPACCLADPLSWTPLEDERLATEASRAAQSAAAALAAETKRNMEAERRAAAKQRLQHAGSTGSKGLSRDAEFSSTQLLGQDQAQTGGGTITADSAVDRSPADSAGSCEALSGAIVPLSVVEVGSFVLENGW